MTNQEKTDFEYIKTIISFCGIQGLNEQGLKRLAELESKSNLIKNDKSSNNQRAI